MSSMDLDQIWKITLAQIEVKIDSPAQFKTWFKDTTLLDIKGNTAEIGVKNIYTSEWLQKKHNKLIKDTLSYVYGSDITPHYAIDKNLINKPTEKPTTEEIIKEVPLFAPQQEQNDQIIEIVKRAALNDIHTFSNYIVGSSNKLAHAAATGVASKPGELYNPLFIYGKTGLGKTHLGQAVGRKMLEDNPYRKILYVSSEGFLNDMVKAIRSGKNVEFRQKYRTLDLLIIDDIQFISKWQETQNEFFNTFNTLYNEKKQIILISDRPPDEIKSIEERLRSRFQGGMTVDVGKPDFEMRIAILEKKARAMGIQMKPVITEYIAKIVTDNIRELEGVLQKVSLYSSMIEQDLAVEEVSKILGKDNLSKREKIKIPLIIKTIAREFKVNAKELKGPRRTQELAFARQICMYFLREEFGYKLEQVAEFLNRKDHTTVIHAVDKIKSKIMIDDGFKNQVDLIKEALYSNELE